MKRFSLNFYSSEDGLKPIEIFLDNISDRKLLAKILRDFSLLEDFGNKLRSSHSKYLRGGIFELRSKQSTNIVRCFYFFQHDNQIILTHGIVKKQNAVPAEEIVKAMNYKTDWEKRNR
ncbi:type II toxin-antitoxin system RelE/ParE family toxin [Bifidobacterium aquikefiri]|uniref:Toxin-antitoxin system, toxin component, RelE family n=1 Tax=Bifidobacterium aquikefiri TaxID=1653207 RepID=A0A261GBE5_9BIFI|nr:toxin-antitoxin system, toxin component, RelE family [Bifidobacterium aquikefiri]